MNKKHKRINVIQPFLPDLKEFIPYLEKIWDSKWLTNNGQFHQQLEKELAEFLGVKHICLFANGTFGLIIALKALEITGEVITTPYSFVATSHSIVWNKATPVFCDIDENNLNIDPEKIEELITNKTTAIMPVHIYGHPCDNERIQAIADRHNLKVIYDAAHAFNVKQNDHSILNWGDLSVLSFHATKVFNTFEGGAIICHDKDMKRKIDDLKNFGFHSETEVVTVGINAKMNEVQAAMGLLQLKYVEDNISKRKKITEYYRKYLKNVEGIKYFSYMPNVTANYSYFPIFVDKNKYGKTRDELYEILKQNNIFSRRYFYPLISQFSSYQNFDSASKYNLPIANKIAEQVLCLPIYPELDIENVKLISEIIKFKK